MSTPTTHNSTVNSFYLAFYGRPADPAGMKFWSEQLSAAGGDIETIKSAFANSDEARQRFGSDTAAERVAQIYQQLFDREPDAAGLDYWVDAIGKGHASVADVAIAVLGGAQGGDRDLATLRQKAADRFTAKVEASGTSYDGLTAVETARVLVRAVKPTATEEDIDALVESATVLTDVATETPEAIEAMGSGEDLLDLLDTEAGSEDPVALVESLAETARGASADAHALAELMKGGGMKKLLASLPEGMTLKDLVATLGKGGLPAAIKHLKGNGGKPGEDEDEGSSVGVEFSLGGEGAKLVLDATVSAEGSAGLKLEDNSTGTPEALDLAFTVSEDGSELSFEAPLEAGLYRLSWTEGTLENEGGALDAGSVEFAGGKAGHFLQEGFAVDKVTTFTGDVTRSAGAAENEAFIDDGSTIARITTGGGQDVVVDNGGTLVLSVDAIDGAAADLILGFDSGADRFEFAGSAAQALDDNGDGKIAWASANAAEFKVDAKAEGVSVAVDAAVVLGTEAGLTQTLATLNAALDLGALGANDELLILATDAAGKGAALFQFVNKDSDGQVDADELSAIAMFGDGALAQADIVLVGTAPAPAA